MHYKLNWDSYIHLIRDIEIRILRKYFGNRKFIYGIEIGAGDGYQSKLLLNLVTKLVCTELNNERLLLSDNQNIQFRHIDAENIDKFYPSQTFDFIYSSNLLEHIPNVNATLQGLYKIATSNSISVHILPNSMWSFLHVLLHYPNIIISKYLKLLKLNDLKKNKYFNNNIKSANKKRTKISAIVLPKPHGVSKNCFVELFYFNRRTWIKIFSQNHFRVEKILTGPITSGYGFGFDKLRNFFTFCGLGSENIYILKKIDENSLF